LSAERAATVVELFATKSIDGTRLSAQGFAEFAPIASNATPDGRAQNRRVSIIIHAPDPP
ncbi:MAG TPA: OmpA family protein, partial [Acidocella sp.]